jgi:hypothetical protein
VRVQMASCLPAERSPPAVGRHIRPTRTLSERFSGSAYVPLCAGSPRSPPLLIPRLS